MNRYISLLLVLLCASVLLNLYLLFIIPKQHLFTQLQVLDNKVKIKQNGSSEAMLNWDLTDQLAKKTPATLYKRSLDDNASLNKPVNNRAELLAQADVWFRDKNFVALGTFLQGYLKQYPQDIEFLLIEAKLKVETTLLSDAIAHYYDLLRKPMTVTQQSEIELHIKQLSKSTIQQLKSNYSWDILAVFVEPLLQLEPSNRLYILSLALAYAELFQEGLMENVLASLDFDDPDAQHIRKTILSQQMISTNEHDIDETTTHTGLSIPLKQFGDQYVVEAILSGNPVALLIDTGASVTAVSKQYFETLDNRYKTKYLGRFSIGTAGGSIMASMYEFQELSIYHVSVKNLPVVILPMQGIENADGLLGMNFLREIDFKIDQRQSVMVIK
jgi:clan AA aspartic protease (TIGR02281 family)